jgi:hypothetical protein
MTLLPLNSPTILKYPKSTKIGKQHPQERLQTFLIQQNLDKGEEKNYSTNQCSCNLLNRIDPSIHQKIATHIIQA